LSEQTIFFHASVSERDLIVYSYSMAVRESETVHARLVLSAVSRLESALSESDRVNYILAGSTEFKASILESDRVKIGYRVSEAETVSAALRVAGRVTLRSAVSETDSFPGLGQQFTFTASLLESERVWFGRRVTENVTVRPSLTVVISGLPVFETEDLTASLRVEAKTIERELYETMLDFVRRFWWLLLIVLLLLMSAPPRYEGRTVAQGYVVGEYAPPPR